MSRPVSVVIPAYNAERHLEEAVRSVLAQTHTDFELIIVNDGSKDDTLAILNRLAAEDGRIRVIDQENRGTAGALNRGLEEATCEWVVIMHADDVMLPERLARQIAFLADNPDVRVTSCMAYYISDRGDRLGKTDATVTTREKFDWHLRTGETIGLLHPGVALHRETALAAGSYRQQFWPAEDIDLWNRIAEHGHLILVQPEVLMCYRIHDGSVSTARFAATRLKYEFVRACMHARRNNQPEPDWETFLCGWNAVQPLQKLSRWRKTTAKACYHAAGHDWLMRRYPPGAFKILAATLLQPEYTVPRLVKQVLR